VLGVSLKDPLQVTPAEEEDVVEAFSSSGAHPALGEGVRPRSPNGGLHHGDSLGPDDLVEGAGELGVSVTEQEMPALELSGHGEVPSLLRDPGGVRPTGRAGDMDASCRQLEEDQDVERLQEHRFNREEIARQHSPPLRADRSGTSSLLRHRVSAMRWRKSSICFSEISKWQGRISLAVLLMTTSSLSQRRRLESPR
jgi:hypothetical protein